MEIEQTMIIDEYIEHFKKWKNLMTKYGFFKINKNGEHVLTEKGEKYKDLKPEEITFEIFIEGMEA